MECNKKKIMGEVKLLLDDKYVGSQSYVRYKHRSTQDLFNSSFHPFN